MLGNFLTGQAGRIAEPAQLQCEPAAPDGGALLSGRGISFCPYSRAFSVAPGTAPPEPLGLRTPPWPDNFVPGISGSGLRTGLVRLQCIRWVFVGLRPADCLIAGLCSGRWPTGWRPASRALGGRLSCVAESAKS